MEQRRLIDRDPADDESAWLAELASEGWVPEHRTGAPCIINGRHVVRYAMIRVSDPSQRGTPEADQGRRTRP